jgi:serine/threonine-protein kinase
MGVSTFTPAGALLATLRGHELLSPDQLEQCHAFLQERPGASARELVNFAIEQEILTHFQADIIQTGNPRTLLLPPFVLLDAAGSGEAGQVYRARGQKDEERYVVKILARGNRAGTPRVVQTLHRFASFRHPAVVPIAHVGTVTDRTFLVWPEPQGERTLEELVQEKGKLPPEQVVHYAIQAAQTLHACHEKGLFHGLLKASDFRVGKRHKLSIHDLGMGFLLTLSREEAAMDTMTSLGQMASGLDWASPESLMDQRDRTPLSDQYSLGCVLYYALTGQVPFPVTSKVRKMLAHQTEEPTPLRELAPEVPARLAAVVEQLMKKAPAERFDDMAEAEAALQALLVKPAAKGTAAPAKPAARPARPKPAQPESDEGNERGPVGWVTWALIGVAAVMAGVIGWLVLP